jgi:hypothetical protein
MSMTQKSVAKAKADASAKVVVFGLDSNWRPRAAWFPHTQADPARAAANQLRLNVIEIANGRAADLVGKLPAGQIHAAGPAMVPPVQEDLYEKVVATINPHGEAGKESGEATAADFPSTYWDGIKPGHVVLAQDSLITGWYEAVVVGRTADKLTLRCRDYPRYPKFTVPVMTVALVNPTGS